MPDAYVPVLGSCGSQQQQQHHLRISSSLSPPEPSHPLSVSAPPSTSLATLLPLDIEVFFLWRRSYGTSGPMEIWEPWV